MPLRALVALPLLAGCAGQTLPDQVSASAVKGTPQAVIEGIVRGGRVLVEVRLNNPTDGPIQVKMLSMTVLGVEPQNCPKDSISMISYPQPIIAARDTGTILVKVAVAKSAPKVCSKARWEVSFASEATPAS